MQWFHPDLDAAYAGQFARLGRLASYERAIDVCDEALGVADGSTHPGWARLRSRCNHLAGRRQRLVVRPSGKLDEDGNPPARRHPASEPPRGHRTDREQVLCAYRD